MCPRCSVISETVRTSFLLSDAVREYVMQFLVVQAGRLHHKYCWANLLLDSFLGLSRLDHPANLVA